MKNPRFAGLLLLLTGVLILMGNTLDALPPQAFWAGLLTYPIGAYLFFFGSRHATESAGAEARRPMPRLPRPPRPAAPETAAPEEETPVPPESRIIESLRRPQASGGAPNASPAPASEPLAFHDLESDEASSGGGSRTVEVQEPQSIADQLQKLTKLQEQGIISAEEYAVAKAKLLG